jgi:hypothetical protein
LIEVRHSSSNMSQHTTRRPIQRCLLKVDAL